MPLVDTGLLSIYSSRGLLPCCQSLTLQSISGCDDIEFAAICQHLLKVICQCHVVFKPPPPVGAGGGYMFSGRPSVPPSVRACVRAYVNAYVRDSRGSFMFPRYLQYLLTDFRQTFVTGAS